MTEGTPTARPAADFDPTAQAPIASRVRVSTGVLQGAATLGVALLVALASRGAPVWMELVDGQADRAQVMNRIATLLTVGFIGSAAVILAAHYLIVARRPGDHPLRRTVHRALPATAVTLALLTVLVIASAGRPDEPGGGGALQLRWFPGLGLASDPVGAQATGPTEIPSPDEAGGAPASGSPPALLLIMLAILAAALAGVVVRAWHWLAGHRRLALTPPPLQPPPAAAREQLTTSLRSVIEAMLRDPDPRTAIIGAYARLLEELGPTEGARREHEAPLEHLHRLLARFRMPAGPLRELVALFELARFSTRPLLESHRRHALDALRTALESLESTTARPVAAPSRRTAATAP